MNTFISVPYMTEEIRISFFVIVAGSTMEDVTSQLLPILRFTALILKPCVSDLFDTFSIHSRKGYLRRRNI